MVKLGQQCGFNYVIGEFQRPGKMFRNLFLSESPPVAELFAECDWKDWVNQDYPNRRFQTMFNNSTWSDLGNTPHKNFSGIMW